VTALAYGAAVVLSAALVMLVQPLAGKTLLPAAGGTPAVWTTCLLFFQALLLAGYAYADRLSRLAPRRQAAVHLAVVTLGGVAAFTLTRAADPNTLPAGAAWPALWLLLFLLAYLGLPFFALAPTSPLLQGWFRRRSPNPYWLYAAGNAGSLVGLLAYPVLVEPNLPIPGQLAALRWGLVVLLPLVALAAALTPAGQADVSVAAPVPGKTRLRWLALAALPSSWLMSATTHLTTDIAPVPLLWVVPLAIYLASFVVVFAAWPAGARRVAGRFTPMVLVFLTVSLVTSATEPVAVVAGLHLAGLAAVTLLCHGELAATRPPASQLTAFYLTLAAGGVLGGLLTAVVAPVVFTHLGHAEYPLAIVLAALIRPGGERLGFTKRDAVACLGFAALLALTVVAAGRFAPPPSTDADPADVLVQRLVRGGLLYGLPAVVAFALVRRPVRFVVCLALLFAAGAFEPGPHGTTLLRTRNFFGTLRVTESLDGRFVRLVHGTTQHGQERLTEPGPPTPLMYYHPTGPAGRALIKLPPPKRVAAVGLGVGALAAYAEPGSHWTFYEIDPAVVTIARDSGYFHFLASARGTVDIELGDARRGLADAPDGSFDLIILDAFSSDAIPVHLLTEEAFALYARKLTPAGVLLAHLSNRYLDLPPLVARLGAAQTPPFALRLDQDAPTDRERDAGKFPSDWAVLFRAPADLGGLAADVRFARPPVTPGPTWRDDFSNLLDLWKRGE
jgi:hypothetical protein